MLDYDGSRPLKYYYIFTELFQIMYLSVTVILNLQNWTAQKTHSIFAKLLRNQNMSVWSDFK